MRKIILFFLLFLFLSGSSVSAQTSSGSLYSELMGKYRSYQNTLEPYKIAKSRLLSYESVASRAEYLKSAKNTLTAEIEAILIYANFIRTRLSEATSILNYQENLYFIKLDDEIASLKLMKDKVDEIASFSELTVFWKDLDDHYAKISQYGYLIKSYIEIGSFSKIFDNLKITKEKINQQITDNISLSANAKAAKDKFSVTEKDYSEILTLFTNAQVIHKSASENNDFKAGSMEVRKLISQTVLKTEKLVSDYQGIVLNLVQ